MDRFMRGFTAGIAGGIAMNIWSLGVVTPILNWEVIRFIDWAAVIIFGDLPRSHLEAVTALLMHLVLVGTLGIVFAFLIPQITSGAYLFKGVLYGLVSTFIIYAISGLFQKPILTEQSLATVTANTVGAIIFGLVMVQTLRWLDKRYTTT